MFASKNKTSLRQGEQFKIMKTMFNNNIKNIGKSGYIGLIEGINGDDKNRQTFDELKIEFETTLGNYEDAYKNHILKLTNPSNINIQAHLNKVIKYGNAVYYITPKGIIKHLEPPDTGDDDMELTLLASKHGYFSSEDIVEISAEEYNIFLKTIGRPLKAILKDGEYFYQKITDVWNKQGSFIVKGNQKAWVDDKGWRYKFKAGLREEDLNDSWPKQGSPEYKSGNVKVWEWNLMDDRNIINENSMCPVIEDSTDTQLISMNNNLKSLAVKMKNVITELYDTKGDTDNEISNADSALNGIVNVLTTKRNNIKNLNYEINSLNGNINDNKHLVKAINAHYLAWGLSFVTIFLLGMYQLKK